MRGKAWGNLIGFQSFRIDKEDDWEFFAHQAYPEFYASSYEELAENRGILKIPSVVCSPTNETVDNGKL
jgi:hypothetical protein